MLGRMIKLFRNNPNKAGTISRFPAPYALQLLFVGALVCLFIPPVFAQSGVINFPDEVTVNEGELNSDLQFSLGSVPTSAVSLFLSSVDLGLTRNTLMIGGRVFTQGDPVSLNGGTIILRTRAAGYTLHGTEDADAIDDVIRVRFFAQSQDPNFNYGGSTAAGTFTVIVRDNDTANIRLSHSALAIQEGTPGTFNVRLDTQPAGEVRLTLSSNSNAGAATVSPSTTLTFNRSNWNTPQIVTVTGVDDADANNTRAVLTYTSAAAHADDADYNGVMRTVAVDVLDDETISVNLSTDALSVNEGGSLGYTVMLGSQPAANVNVTVSSGEPGAVTAAPTSLMFTRSNWNAPQTVTVTGVPDDDTSNENNVMLSHAVTSGDGGYNNLNVAAVLVSVTDNDMAGVSVTPTNLRVDEGGNNRYTVVLDTRPAVNVMLAVRSAMSTAATASPTPLTFTPDDWNRAQTVTVAGLEDGDGNDVRVDLSHALTTLDPDYRDVTPAGVTVTVTDNDTVGVTVSPTSLSINEGGSGSYNVVLNTLPIADVMLAVTSANTAAASASPTPLMFTRGNWDRPQIVTVTGVDDADSANATVRLTHAVTSTDPGYRVVTPDAVTVTVTDDEGPGVSISSSTLSVDEGGSGGYTLMLNTRPTNDVTLTVVSENTAIATASPASLTFTSTDWNMPRTVTVSGVADDDGRDASVRLTHTAQSTDTNYADTTVLPVTVTVRDDDMAGLTFSPVSPTVTEGGSVVYTAMLDTRPAESVTLSIATEDSDAATVSPTRLTFSPQNWNMALSVTVRGIEDVDAGDESVRLNHVATSTDSSYNNVSAVVTARVTDDETASVTVSHARLNVTEGGSGSYGLVLSSQPSAAVSVMVMSTEPGRATATPATLSFTRDNWNTAQMVTVNTIVDVNRTDDSVSLRHTTTSGDPLYNAVRVDPVVVNVRERMLGVTVNRTSLSLSEGSSVNLTVVLDAPPIPGSEIGVSIQTSNQGVARPDSIFRLFTPANWNMPLSWNVSGVSAGTATLSVALDSPGAGADTAYNALSGTVQVPVTVARADVAINPGSVSLTETGSTTYALTLNTRPTGEVRVNLTSSDPAAATVASGGETQLIFTPASWATPRAVTVTGVADSDTRNERLRINHVTIVSSDGRFSSRTLSHTDVFVRDASNPVGGVTISKTTSSITEGDTDTYTVVLDTAPTEDVRIAVASNNRAAVAVAPAALVFTSGNWNRAQTVTMTAVQDGDVSNEQAQVQHTVTSADTSYHGEPVADVRVSVTDDDVVGIRLSNPGPTLTEGRNTAYTVVLASQPSAAVSIALTSADRGAVTVNPATLMFSATNWNVPKTVNIAGVQDSDTNAERVRLTHTATSADENYDGLTSVATASVTDDDTVLVGVTVTPVELDIGEGATGTYRLVLVSQPSADVRIAVASDDPEAVTSTTLLTFNRANWNRAQTVTVSALQDADANNESVRLSHTLSSADRRYNADVPVPVTVRVRDNDTAGMTASETTLTINENADVMTASYMLVLNTRPSAEVTVAVGSDDRDAARGTPAQLRFTQDNWNRVQTVTVRGRQDNDVRDERVTLSHTATSMDRNYAAVAPASAPVTVTVTDDDIAGVTVAPGSVTLQEGRSTTYRLVLDAQPSQAVTVAVASDDTDAATVSPARLMFSAANWNRAQTFTVTGVEDIDLYNEDVRLSHRITTTDTVYTRVRVAAVTATVEDNDGAGVTVSPTMRTIDEGGMGNYTLVLNARPDAPVTIAVSNAGSAAATVSPASLTFTTDNWNAPRTVTVAGVEDADRNNATVSLSHRATSTDNAYNDVRIESVALTVTDNEVPGVTLTPANLVVTEGGTTTLTVVLNAPPLNGAFIDFRERLGNHLPVTANPETLAFNATNWDTPRTVTLRGTQDRDANNHSEMFTYRTELNFNSTADDRGYANRSAGVPLIILDDDGGPAVSVSPTMLTVDEGGTISYNLALNAIPTVNVTIAVTSDDAEAVTATTLLTFTRNNWRTAQAVTVMGLADADADNETVSLTHAVTGSDARYTVLTPAPVTVTVTDDEIVGVTVTPTRRSVNEGGTGTYTMMLNARPAAPVTIAVTSEDAEAVTATTPLIFDRNNWNQPQAVTVTGEEDADANDEVTRLTHAITGTDTLYRAVTPAPVTINVTDDETAMSGVTLSRTTRTIDEGQSGIYRMTLNTQPSENVTVMVTSGNMAAVTAEPATLTFDRNNWNQAQTVTVRGVEDDDANNVTVTLTHTTASTDTAYDGNAVTIDAVDVTVEDDDVPGAAVALTALTVAEGGTGSYTVVLNTRPTTGVRVTVSASNNMDAVTATTPLTFDMNNWNVPQRVTVRGVDDADANNVRVTLIHTAASMDTAYDGNRVAIAPVQVTVEDDDTPSVTVNQARLTLAEGGTDTYGVMLDTQPSANVTVMVSNNNVDAATATASLRFTTSDWNTLQTVTVRGVEDDDANNETVSLTHTAVSTDAAYNGNAVTITPVMVRVTDNDTPGVTVDPAALMVSEGGIGSYTVVLDTRPNDNVMVTVMPPRDNIDAAMVTPASLSFDMNNWNIPRTVRVMGVDDGDMQDETVSLTHTAASTDAAYNGNGVTITPVMVTVRDNDTPGVSVTPSTLMVPKGGTGTYTVVLNTQSSTNVDIALLSGNTSAATVSPTSLRFTGRNWNQPQMVTVTGVQDNDGIDKNVQLMHTVTSEDSTYDATKVIAINVTVTEMAAFNLDVDGSGGTANQSDGLIIGRYLFGIRDARGLLDTIPGNPSFNAVTANIAGAFASGLLDVDGSGGTANQSDGLLIGRYLFGIRDARGLLDTIPGNPSFSGVTTNIGGLVR